MLKKYFHKFWVLIIICSFNITLQGQTIIGTITDSLNNPIPNASITITEHPTSNKILTFAISNKDGYFDIKTPNLNTYSLNVKALSYKPTTVLIKDKNKKEQLLIILKNNIDSLDEVILVSKKSPKISIRNDTTIFNAESFKRGDVKVIEDLLKNLPGFNLRDDGKFTFKGKVVETLLVDGTDIFNNDYTVATKNLDADLIKEVEAIENYFKNPLLTGLSETDAVAVNLKIKTGVADVITTNDIAAGIEHKYQARSTLLSVSNKLKSFNNISFNNTGIENSPYNYYRNNNVYSIEQDAINKENIVIRGNGFINDFTPERARLNKNLFGSLNGVHNVNTKLSFKFNGDYKNDNLSQTQTETTTYFTENTTERNITSKIESKPTLATGSLEGILRINDRSSVLYNGTLFFDDIETTVSQILNDEASVNLQNDKNKVQKHKILYTNRINKNEAFIFQTLLNSHILDQEYFLSNNEQSVTSNTLFNSNKLEYYNSKLEYDIKFSLGYNYEESKFSSFNLLNSINDLKGFYRYPWIELKTNNKFGLFTMSTLLNVKYLTQSISKFNSSFLEFEQIQVNPKFSINYEASENGSIKLTGLYSETNLSLSNQYSNTILASPTLQLNNGSNIEPLKRLSLQLRYSYFNLLELTHFNVTLDYNKRFNNFVSELSIDPNETSTTKILRNLSTNNVSFNTGIDIYAPFIKSNVKINSNVGFETYNNSLNNAVLRNVNSYSNNNSLTIKSGFFGIFNFENTITNTNLKFKATYNSEIYSITNNLYLYIKPNDRIKLGATLENYHPDLNSSSNFYFLDFDLSYTSISKKFTYSIISKNITSQNAIIENNLINDILESNRSYTINNPFLLFKIEFSL